MTQQFLAAVETCGNGRISDRQNTEQLAYDMDRNSKTHHSTVAVNVGESEAMQAIGTSLGIINYALNYHHRISMPARSC